MNEDTKICQVSLHSSIIISDNDTFLKVMSLASHHLHHPGKISLLSILIWILWWTGIGEMQILPLAMYDSEFCRLPWLDSGVCRNPSDTMKVLPESFDLSGQGGEDPPSVWAGTVHSLEPEESKYTTQISLSCDSWCYTSFFKIRCWRFPCKDTEKVSWLRCPPGPILSIPAHSLTQASGLEDPCKSELLLQF